jgi:cytochrome c oxidase subunit 2
MILLVVAEPPDKFQQWFAAQRQPAAVPENEQQLRGQRLFESRPCLLCHTIRGTLAGGRVGPDLTHIGSRQRIATNMLENNTANLSAWIVNAQSLKPGVLMPNVTQFSGDELRDIEAYLRHLR